MDRNWTSQSECAIRIAAGKADMVVAMERLFGPLPPGWSDLSIDLDPDETPGTARYIAPEVAIEWAAKMAKVAR